MKFTRKQFEEVDKRLPKYYMKTFRQLAEDIGILPQDVLDFKYAYQNWKLKQKWNKRK